MRIQIAIIVACIALALPASAQRIEVPAAQAPELAVRLLRSGNIAQAQKITDALLTRNPADAQALLLRTDIALLTGRFDDAIAFGKRAFSASNRAPTKLQAARLVALGYSKSERYSRAQLWLRRASNFATTPQSAQQIAHDYRAVSRANPLQANLRFGILPSNNINNGSSGSQFAFGQFLTNQGIFIGIGPDVVVDLEGSSKQLSGYEFSTGADLSYRLQRSQTSSTFATMAFDFKTYTLSKDAQAQAPDAKGSDYENGSLSFGLAHNQLLPGNNQPLNLRLTIGQTWFEQEPYQRFTELSFSQNYKISNRDTLGLNGYVTDRENVQTTAKSRTRGLRLSWTHVYDNKDSFRIGLHGKTSEANRLDDTNTSYEISADYRFAKPFAGMKFSLGLDYGETHHPQSVYAADRGSRSAVSYGLRGSIQFTNIEYYGFQPAVTFERSQTKSTVELFDRDNFNIGFDLRSSF